MIDNMRIKKIFLILIISLIIFLTGCTNNEQQDLVSKCNEQINYLDTKLFSMANSLNNIPVYNYKLTSQEAKIQEETSQGSNSGQSSSSGGQSESGGGTSGGSDNGSASEQQNQQTISITQMDPNSVLISNSDIDWKSVKTDIEGLHEVWGTIILDLYKLNLDNNNILGFSADLDSTTTAIKSENKAQSLTRNSQII